jgi:hypothetical protein
LGGWLVDVGACVWFLSTFKPGDVMNEKLRKMLENHGVDIAVGSPEYWQNEIEMVMAEIWDEAAAAERKICFDLVYNHEDTYHHFGLCKRAAELIKERGLT